MFVACVCVCVCVCARAHGGRINTLIYCLNIVVTFNVFSIYFCNDIWIKNNSYQCNTRYIMIYNFLSCVGCFHLYTRLRIVRDRK